MHNPWDGNWPLVCDWECHLGRGSAGGDDYAMPVGTPVTAAFSGTLRNVYDATQNLNKAELTADHDPKLSFYHLHVSRFAPAGHYDEGDVIAWSGGAPGAHGSGTATGPHLHVNAFYAGVIRDVHDYFTSTASTETKPIPAAEQDQPMYILLQSSGRGQWIVGPNYKHHLNLEESGQVFDWYKSRGLFKDCGTNDRAFDVWVSAHTVPTK